MSSSSSSAGPATAIIPARPSLLYKMRGLPNDPDGAKEPHHHIYVLKVKARAWLVCCYSAGGTAIEKRKERAWPAMQLPPEVGFPEIDLGRHVTFYHKASQGHRTILDIASMRSWPLADVVQMRLHPSGEIDPSGHRRVLEHVEQYVEWVDRNRPHAQTFNANDRKTLKAELCRLAA